VTCLVWRCFGPFIPLGLWVCQVVSCLTGERGNSCRKPKWRPQRNTREERSSKKDERDKYTFQKLRLSKNVKKQDNTHPRRSIQREENRFELHKRERERGRTGFQYFSYKIQIFLYHSSPRVWPSALIDTDHHLSFRIIRPRWHGKVKAIGLMS